MFQKREGPSLSQEQVSIHDLESNALAFLALTGGEITKEDWMEILASEKLIGDADRLDRLSDYLMSRGQEIETIDQLRKVVKEIIN